MRPPSQVVIFCVPARATRIRPTSSVERPVILSNLSPDHGSPIDEQLVVHLDQSITMGLPVLPLLSQKLKPTLAHHCALSRVVNEVVKGG